MAGQHQLKVAAHALGEALLGVKGTWPAKLIALADAGANPWGDSWRLDYERVGRAALREALSELSVEEVAQLVALSSAQHAGSERSPFEVLFRVSELHAVDYGTELWGTRPLDLGLQPASGPSFSLAFLASQVSKPESHQRGGFDYHLHPLDTNYKHLPYKFLFSSHRTQEEMSWELHGLRGRKVKRWGDPAVNVLNKKHATTLWKNALAACQKHWKSESFEVWAARFGGTGRTSYYAHPPQTRGHPRLFNDGLPDSAGNAH